MNVQCNFSPTQTAIELGCVASNALLMGGAFKLINKRQMVEGLALETASFLIGKTLFEIGSKIQNCCFRGCNNNHLVDARYTIAKVTACTFVGIFIASSIHYFLAPSLKTKPIGEIEYIESGIASVITYIAANCLFSLYQKCTHHQAPGPVAFPLPLLLPVYQAVDPSIQETPPGSRSVSRSESIDLEYPELPNLDIEV
jgi:hypothetical protein